MKQLELFEKQPKLKVGCCYAIKNRYSDDEKLVYVSSSKVRGDTWSPWATVSYFVTMTNDRPNTIHDCGLYIYERGLYASGTSMWDVRTDKINYRKLEGSELTNFVRSLRDQKIRNKFLGVDIAKHPEMFRFYKSFNCEITDLRNEYA
jgi:hypothetical protein